MTTDDDDNPLTRARDLLTVYSPECVIAIALFDIAQALRQRERTTTHD
jgi:hypothetical protein